MAQATISKEQRAWEAAWEARGSVPSSFWKRSRKMRRTKAPPRPRPPKALRPVESAFQPGREEPSAQDAPALANSETQMQAPAKLSEKKHERKTGEGFFCVGL